MRHRSAIRGAARIQQRGESEYWVLVRQLMDAGWHRLGPGRDPARQTWGFRHSYTVTSGPDGMHKRRQAEERWVEAKDELAAMRRLVREL